MAFPCINPCTVCPPRIPGGIGIGPLDPNDPFLNISSEAPDFDYFISRRYTPGPPPVGHFFYAIGCLGFCFSDVSQAEADLCAARQNAICSSFEWPNTERNPGFIPGNPGTPPTTHRDRPTYSNREQSCTYDCPSGGTNTNIVPAGTIRSLFSQLAADTQAQILCQQQAQAGSLCLSSMSPDRICINEPANIGITASSPFAVALEIFAGSLPAGLDWDNDPDNNSLTITGTPTAGGQFDFTVLATDTNGKTAQRDYTLDVFGITTAGALTPGSESTAYLQALAIDGTPVGGYDFAVVSGALPSGLTLNSTTGIISGTPTTAGNYSFTIKVEDSELLCQRDFTLVIGADCAGNPSTIGALTWVYTGNGAPCGSGSMAAGAATYSNTRNFGVCIGGGDACQFDTVMCNPGAPYLLTLDGTWNLSGASLPFPGFDFVYMELVINGASASSQVNDPAVPSAGVFPQVQALLPTGQANTVRVRVQVASFPNPSITFSGTLNLT